jgi:hypothetical protein
MGIHTLQKFLLGTFLTVLSLPLCNGVTGAAHAARNLAQRVYDRVNGTDVSTRSVMSITTKGEEPRRRVLYTFALETGNGKRLSLARFVSPRDVEGVQPVARAPRTDFYEKSAPRQTTGLRPAKIERDIGSGEPWSRR